MAGSLQSSIRKKRYDAKPLTASHAGLPYAGFSNPDDHGSAGLTPWLEWIESLPQSIKLRKYTYRLLDTSPGDRILDIGCGTGRAVFELSQRGANAVGIDVNAQMIAVARRRFPRNDFRVGSAEDLKIADGHLDLYRAEAVYQHLSRPRLALAEAFRVLKPGGKAVIADQDYGMWVIDSCYSETTAELKRVASAAVTNPLVGRQLGAFIRDAGFVSIKITVLSLVHTSFSEVSVALRNICRAAVTTKQIEQAEGRKWLAEQVHRGRKGQFLMVVPFFVVSGRRPGSAQGTSDSTLLESPSVAEESKQVV
jgi:ubiquinone/menaquinone biosynthesis C-methylase UbiE